MELATNPTEKKDLRIARRRFRVALGLFFVWVTVLGVMAIVSGRRPTSSPAAIEER